MICPKMTRITKRATKRITRITKRATKRITRITKRATKRITRIFYHESRVLHESFTTNKENYTFFYHE